MKKYLLPVIILLFFPGLLLSVGNVTDQPTTCIYDNSGYQTSDSVSDNLAERIKIYPVPVKDELTAENINDVTKIEIFDVTGKKCLNEVCDNDFQRLISVSELRRGIYFIRFITPKATIMKRFIKE